MFKIIHFPIFIQYLRLTVLLTEGIGYQKFQTVKL